MATSSSTVLLCLLVGALGVVVYLLKRSPTLQQIVAVRADENPVDPMEGMEEEDFGFVNPNYDPNMPADNLNFHQIAF